MSTEPPWSSAVWWGALWAPACQSGCALPLTLSLASMGQGIVLIIKVAHMPAVVLAMVLGAMLDELVYLERGIGRGASRPGRQDLPADRRA